MAKAIPMKNASTPSQVKIRVTRTITVLALGAAALALSGCAPAQEPLVNTILTKSHLTGFTPVTDKIQPYCGPSSFGCSQPVYEITFTAPATIDPARACHEFIDSQMHFGAVAYGDEGYPAANIGDISTVEKFCLEGLQEPTIPSDGTHYYFATVLYDDGKTDGIGKISVIRRDTSNDAWVVDYAISKDLASGYAHIDYGNSTPTHPTVEELNKQLAAQAQMQPVQDFARTVIGMSEAQAVRAISRAGYLPEVAIRDDTPADANTDQHFNPQRIRLVMVKGKVYDALVG
jgi:hypothetical protein